MKLSSCWMNYALRRVSFAPPAVSRGRLFHFDRYRDDNRLTCRNAETGQLLWKFEYPTDYDDL